MQQGVVIMGEDEKILFMNTASNNLIKKAIQ